MDVADIDSHLLVLLRLHPPREGHRLSLYATVGVEGGNGFHTLVCRHDGGEGTVGIVLEFLYCHATSEAAATGQLARVVEEIGMSLEVSHATVIGERSRIRERHDLSDVCPGS